ncbi:hypothetical protein HHJ78_09565 [Mobiluncus mulieris]|uniref:Uncharacterized protein n=1 Tax=Mobiluncus mulieris TaxID=2052 RepID=A0A7Y0U2T9_9ACTO|nr:hypothetical protein [Mobiluncus mulieris]NMW65752.1 hypothetical protein [Mobiluncus mulieris]
MRRETLTSIESDFLAELRQQLLKRPRAASLTAEQAAHALKLTQAILDTPTTLSEQVGAVCRTGAVCDWLGISRQAVHKAVQDQRILGFQTLDNKWIYPVWQFEAPEIYEACIHGLPPVLDVLDSRGVNGIEAAAWFAAPNRALTGTLAGKPPLQAFSWEPEPPVSVLVAAAKRATPPAKPRPLPRLSEVCAVSI